MTGFDASVLNDPSLRLLVVAPNWLGDGIMAMPALQELKSRLHPEAELTVGARPGQLGLWRMHPAPDHLFTLSSRARELPSMVRAMKKSGFTHAVILPNSFRSALVPALAGIPFRRGTSTQTGRRLLINESADLTDLHDKHQQCEMAALLLPAPIPESLASPHLNPSTEAAERAGALIDTLPPPRLGLIPGAARGPSKQWSADRFRLVAQAWVTHTGGGVCWLGTPADMDVCEACNEGMPPKGCSLAGKTDLETFTAVLSLLDAVTANDSGGMHLSAAVGTPVVAIFGLTDPAKTGPLHEKAQVVQHAVGVDRAVARKSDAAKRALDAVTAEEVIERVLAISTVRG